MPEQKLVEEATKHLALPEFPVDWARISGPIGQMAETKALIVEPGFGDRAEQQVCSAPAFYHTEVALASRLSVFARIPVDVDVPRVERWIDGYTQKQGISLSQEQRRAVILSASSRLLVLTGGPGCGKTFTTKMIVALWKAMGKSILLAAPTGRAAQRLAEMSGREAKTIHRLLALDPKTMQFRHSEQVPVVRLTEVFRQAAKSHIITNAHRINAGQFPQLTPTTKFNESDCLWLAAAEPALGAEGIGHLVREYLPKHGINPVQQVLCPTTRGEAGTRQLNSLLQKILNPAAPEKVELFRGGTVLR